MDKSQATFFKALGRKIRDLRVSKGITLEDMQEFSFSTAHFQKIETGKKGINLYTAYRIAKALKIDLSALLKGL